MKRRLAIALLCSFAAAPAVAADIQPTYHATWDQVAAISDCAKTERPDVIVFTCEKDLTIWYFTVPGTPAHPGVMKRAMVSESDGTYFKEDARSYGTDEAQPAFKAWMAPILDLDRQAKDYIAKHKD